MTDATTDQTMTDARAAERDLRDAIGQVLRAVRRDLR